MNSNLKVNNRILHKIKVVKKIPEQLKGYWKVEQNGQYVGYAAIR